MLVAEEYEIHPARRSEKFRVRENLREGTSADSMQAKITQSENRRAAGATFAVKWVSAALLAGVAMSATQAAVLGTFESDRESWALKMGPEFPGAKGSVERTSAAARTGDYGLKVTADFSAGGKYVEISKSLSPSFDSTGVSFWVKTENVAAVGLRLVDSTGRAHQQSCKVPDGSGWKRITVTEFDGGVKPGWALRPAWHGPAGALSLLLEKDSLEDQKKPGKVWLDDVEMAGSFVTPLPRLGGLDLRMRMPRPLLYYWGKEDAPTAIVLDFTAATGPAAKLPEIRLLDGHGNAVGAVPGESLTLKQGQTARRKFVVKPPRYGFFSIAIGSGEEQVRVPLAWLAAAAPAWEESPFGVQMHFAHGTAGRHQTLGGAEGALALVKKMGAAWYRDEVPWGHVEREPTRLAVPTDTANPYFHPGPAAEMQLHPMVILGGTNKIYDGGKPPTSPEGLTAFRRYIEAAVKTWKPYVRDWEVWNEPNIPPGWPNAKPDGAGYTAILKTAWQEIKAVDPKATVVGCATSGVDLKFVQTVLENGGGKWMDAVSVHPYLSVAPEALDPNIKVPSGLDLPDPGQTFLGELKNLRALLDRHGAAHCKIWLTEMGYGPQGSRNLGELQIACEDVRLMLLALSVPGVERFCKYNFQDRADDDAARPDKRMGLVRFDGGPKPGFVAYNTMVRMLTKKRFAAAHECGKDARLFEFADDAGPVFAAWAASGKKKVTVETKAAFVTLTDLMGNETKLPVTGGSAAVEVTGEPVFIVPGDAVAPAGGGARAASAMP